VVIARASRPTKQRARKLSMVSRSKPETCHFEIRGSDRAGQLEAKGDWVYTLNGLFPPYGHSTRPPISRFSIQAKSPFDLFIALAKLQLLTLEAI